MQQFLNIQPLQTGLPLEGTDWNYVEVVRPVDGDTARILRTQARWTLEESEDIGDNLIRSEWKVIVVEDDIEDGPDSDDLPDGFSSRLILVDTPERGQVGYREATDDLTLFCAMYRGRLRCVSYDSQGGFDRLLVDLYVLDDDGTVVDTASQWMLRERGWPLYVK